MAKMGEGVMSSQHKRNKGGYMPHRASGVMASSRSSASMRASLRTWVPLSPSA